MKQFLSLCLLGVFAGSALCAGECRCIDCKCTKESHCGCMAGIGFQSADEKSCGDENCPHEVACGDENCPHASESKES